MLIWVQSVCKSYQQATLGDKDLTQIHVEYIVRNRVHFHLHRGLSLAPLDSNIFAIGMLLVITATSKGVRNSLFTLKRKTGIS